MAGLGLTKSERVRTRAQFDALFLRGGVGKSRLLVVRAIPNGLCYSRMASAVSRKSGNAVVRNRIRRRLRAAYRQCKPDWPMGYDYVFLARRGVAEADWHALSRDVNKALTQAVRAVESQP